MTVPIFVDTNVLVYARDAAAGVKQQMAEGWMKHLWQARTGRTSYQVLQEFYVTVTRKLTPGLEPKAARDEARTLLAWDPLPVDAAMMDVAWRLEDRYAVSWWDALILAAAHQAGCGYLLTEDLQPGQVFDTVTIVDPFRNF